MQGRYKVKSPDLKPHVRARHSSLSKQIPYFTIEHVRRELNQRRRRAGQRGARFRQRLRRRSELTPSRTPRRKRKKRRSRRPPRRDAARALPPPAALGDGFRFPPTLSRARSEGRTCPGRAARSPRRHAGGCGHPRSTTKNKIRTPESELAPKIFFAAPDSDLYWSSQIIRQFLERQLDTKSGKQVKQPGEGIVLILPIAAMCALIGILALLMRSTGKW